MSILMIATMFLLTSSIMFTIVTHPISMGMIIMFQTVSICLTSMLNVYISWFSYILFLVFLGAIMVLFIYVTSLAANEMFQHSATIWALPLMALPALIINDLILSPFMTSPEASSIIYNEPAMTAQITLSPIYNYPFMPVTLFVGAYLLLTLIVVVKLSSKFLGPMRST